jgi:predicted dehydrogenase
VLESPHVELAAVIDTSRSRAERVISDFQLRAKVASSISEVRDSVDGVIVATPNHTHSALAIECLTLGLPVLIEKPIASTVADAATVVAMAARSKLVASVGYCTRFWDNVCLLGELLDSNYFGAVHRFVYQLGISDWAPPVSGYSFSRAAAGGGVLIVNGSHFIDRMLHWFGFPDEVEYSDDSLGGPEATAVGSLQWSRERALQGTIRLSKVRRLPSGLVLETDAGIVTMHESAEAPLLWRPQDRAIELIINPRRPRLCPDDRAAFRLQLEDFVSACRNSQPPRVSAEEGLESLRMIDMLYARRRSVHEPRTPAETARVL